MAEQSVPVRVTKKRYQHLKKDAEKNGHTLSWLLNFIIDLHYQSDESYLREPRGLVNGADLRNANLRGADVSDANLLPKKSKKERAA